MIDQKTVEHVAKLARVNLTNDEVEKFSKEFSDILDLFSSLKDIKTDGIEPSFHPIELKNVVREDEPESCLTQKEALSNTEQKDDGFFKGPRSV